MNTTQVSKYLIKAEMQGVKVMNNLREFLLRLTLRLKTGGHLNPLLFQPVTLFICCNSFHFTTIRPLVFEPMLPTVLFFHRIN